MSDDALYPPASTASQAAEQPLGELTPSLVLGVPRLLGGIAVALVGSYYLPLFVGLLPYWFFLAFWIVCLAPGLWGLLVLATTQFEITTQRIYYSRGVLNRQRDQLEIFRIRDLSTYKPLIQRLFGLGCVRLETVDRSHPILLIQGQSNADALKDRLHQLNLQERQRIGYREFEST